MDLVTSCKEKLTHFRMKDLKDILTQLSISKQGKKQVLVNRVLDLLSDDQATRFAAGGKRSTIAKERIAKIIEEAYRKIPFSGAMVFPSAGPNLERNNVSIKAEAKNTYKVDKKVRCICGQLSITESMVKCEDRTCEVWQHASCVFIPEKPTEFAQVEIPEHFFCEICRLKRADPFLVAESHPSLPSLLSSTSIAQDGTTNIHPTQSQRTFQLSRSDKDRLQRAEFDLQVWCILLNDKVPFRMQWPQFTELHVNGIIIRATNRAVNQPLGANGRDDGPIISGYSQEGTNKISLSKSDARVFCFGVRIVRRRTFQQVMSLIPKEEEGESFDNALSRICRSVGGGNIMENTDSDSDIEVVAESVVVNLRCPLSGARIKTAGRFMPCVHRGCFDLGTLIELNQHSRKWQCPICLKNYSLEDIIIDPYFNRISSMLKEFEEDVDEIEIRSDGSWKVNNEGCKDLGQWHSPDGSHLVPCSIDKHGPDVQEQSKQDVSDKQNKDLNGSYVIDNNELVRSTLLVDYTLQKFGNQNQQAPVVSGRAPVFHGEQEYPGIDQEGKGYFGLSTDNACQLGSTLNCGISQSSYDTVLPGLGDKDIILVSDSEDDANSIATDSENACVRTTTSVPFSAVDPGVSGKYPRGTNGGSCMENFSNGHGVCTSGWPSIDANTSNQMDLSVCNNPSPPEFTTIDANTNVEQSLIDAHYSTCHWPPIYGSSSAASDSRANALQSRDYFFHPDLENDIILDNQLAFDANPSLQYFLPTQPLQEPVHRNLNAPERLSGTFDAGDWISLRLGDTGLDHGESSSAGGLDPGHHQFLSMQNKDCLGHAGSSHLGMNNDARSTKMVTDSQRSNDPRSVKPRLSLSIDLNSND